MITERLPPHISAKGKFEYVIGRFYCVIYVSLDFLLHKATQIRYDIVELILGISTNSTQHYVVFFVLLFSY